MMKAYAGAQGAGKYHFTGYTRKLYDSRLRFLHSMRLKTVLDIVKRRADLVGGKKVLEIGCMDLFFLCLLCEAGLIPENYIGIDVFWEKSESFATQNAVTLSNQYGFPIKLHHAGVEESEEKSLFETIILLETLEHLHDEERTIEKIIHWLSPGGHVLVSLPVEYGALFGVREAARSLVKGSSPYSIRDYLSVLVGKTQNVERIPGDHKGYDFRNTILKMKSKGLICIEESFYPFPIPWMSYGYVGLYKLPNDIVPSIPLP